MRKAAVIWKEHLGRVQQGKSQEDPALLRGSQSQVYGDGINFQVVSGRSF